MIALIVAYDEARVMGHKGRLPWHLPKDLAYFKRVTHHKKVVMGRKTYASIVQHLKGPLPNRENIVISTTMTPQKGIEIIDNLQAFLQTYALSEEVVFVIGGKQVYETALPFAQKLYITHVKGVHEGDVHFPEVDFSHYRLLQYDQQEWMAFAIYERID